MEDPGPGTAGVVVIDAEDAPRGSGGRRPGPATLAVVALVVALLAVGAWQGASWRSDAAREDDRSAVLAAATAEVEGLIGISSSTSDDDIEQLLDGATSGFRSELEAQADRLREALSSNDVTATGEVVSAAVVSLKGDRATVIAAATGTVKNKSTAAAEPRNYRLKVELARTDDSWLVSGLEFVA